ncbi:MAG: RES family NAD+ phosphorylase [Verrucomicrobia bacterium]|nr:RES family NAD+ phosphorylase [Verrucomicrobiota bacterium]
MYYRLHPRNPETGNPWGAVLFSQRGTTRFDPADGAGTLYLADSLAGGVLEMFGDRLEPLGSIGRGLSRRMLGDWFATLIAIPQATLFEASGANLSKLGVDLQLLAGDHAAARLWALRLMQHPAGIDGILYPSRHDDTRRNMALFQRPALLPVRGEASLTPPASTQAPFATRQEGTLLHGPALCLREHPELPGALAELEVALLP